MNTLAVLATLVCLKPTIINDTGIWSKLDQDTLERSTKQCEIRYKNAPCLKKFIKRGETNYNAICGAKE